MLLTQLSLPETVNRCLRLMAMRWAAVVALLGVGLSWSPIVSGDELPTGEEAGQVVVDVKIEGNETIPESIILQKIQSQPNRPVTERQLREDIRSLSNTRWFFSVRDRIEETPQGKVLIFTVHERPIVQKVTFIGNKKVKLKYLEAWTGLKAGSPFDHRANQDAVDRIIEEYKEKGFYFIEVTLEKGGKPGEREVVFRIVEGPKVRVQYRTFDVVPSKPGDDPFWNDGDLRKNLQSKEALLGFFGGFYKPDLLPQDVEAIKQFYRGVGFFDVEVDAVPKFSPDRASVDLHFKVRENTRYTVRQIRYQGNSIIATGQLKGGSKLLAGQKFNSHPLSKDVRRMLKYYGDKGHYFASVEPVPHFTEDPGIVDLVFEIDEDRPRYIRDISVTYDGDYPHTKQTVVLDRMQLVPGDLADPNLLKRSRSRLNGSGLFEPGLEFDVTPVEPGQMSFASSTRTFRGQSRDAASQPDSWTGRFETYTQRSAQLTANGIYEWLDDSWFESEDGSEDSISTDASAAQDGGAKDAAEFTPESGSETPDESEPEQQQSHRSRPGLEHAVYTVTSVETEGAEMPSEGTQVPEASFGGYQGFGSSRVSQPAAMFTETDVPKVFTSVTSEVLSNSSVDHQGNLNNVAVSPVSAVPGAGVAEAAIGEPELLVSELTGHRPVAPDQFFSSDESLFLASSHQDFDAPVIRGQSPGGVRDPATPGPRDPVLEGSPYRNQFNTIPPGWVDIDVKAAEGRTGRLMFGAGVNSDAGLVGSFVWDESNFDLFRPPQTFADIIEGRAWRGGGQRFRAEAAPGSQVSRYAISWTDPYFMYSDYSLTLSGFYFNRFYPDWDEDRLGGRIGVGRQFTPEWSANVALRLEDVQLKNPKAPTPAVLQRDVGSNFLSTARFSVTHDTRDMAIMPGEGHYADVAYEQAFGQYTYPRFETDARQYFTIYNRPDGSGRQVLTLAGNLGWSGDETPVFERYFAGGFQSFRGFSFRGVTPRTAGVSTGGVFQMLGTVEYRVPVTADDMINVVGFTDFGSIEEEITLNNFRMTAGFGLRVVIPAMGPVPLAFDFAFPIKSQSFDDERVFSFYVGINR
jgi:outer membrane protein insertion porin family